MHGRAGGVVAVGASLLRLLRGVRGEDCSNDSLFFPLFIKDMVGMKGGRKKERKEKENCI